MRLLDNLRNAEQKSKQTMRRGMERVREEWGDLERRIRQRMRIYPQKITKLNSALSRHGLEPDMIEQGIPTGIGEAEPEREKPIVSIHGKDINEEDLNKPAAA